ncbi:MAG: ABC transporter ATP-binding protein, partial [Gammaproteobacteria bacterium]
TVALVGESGSGKSVIAQSILGILPNNARITRGEILFDDTTGYAEAVNDKPGCVLDIAGADADAREMQDIRGGRISMIFQEPMTSLSPLHTIGNQIVEGVLLHRQATKKEACALAAEMLARVGFPQPEKALNTYPFELSGGLRQRAMIAMALVCRPALLIADEPTTALDVTIQAQILKLIQDLQAELGMAVLLITHDLGVVANMADEVVVVYHGQVMESGTVSDIYGNARHPYLQALMRAVPRVGMPAGERLTPIREVNTSTGAHLAESDAPLVEIGNGAQPLLRVRRVSKSYRLRSEGMFGTGPEARVSVLQDVSLHVHRGECLGVVGESGSGKTTLAKVILRTVNADMGEVLFDDNGKVVSLFGLTDKELLAYRRKIQYVFQDPVSSLNPRMTVFDIISEPLIINRIGDREQRRELVKELMNSVGLDPRYLSRYPHSFSGGQRQRIGIARALALKPQLLICDEPVSALDVSVQAQILNLLKDLQAEMGLTYLFISHNLAVVDYMAARIAVICAGQLVEMAPREMLFQSPVHPYTKALLAAVPRTDPDYKLDLSALMEGRASDPRAWPAPFSAADDEQPELVDMGAGHFVRLCPSRQSQAHA